MITIDRLQRGLVTAAYVVTRHGAVYAPIFDRLERELKARQADDPIERARAMLRKSPIAKTD